jgi:hypothetical protein
MDARSQSVLALLLGLHRASAVFSRLLKRITLLLLGDHQILSQRVEDGSLVVAMVL